MATKKTTKAPAKDAPVAATAATESTENAAPVNNTPEETKAPTSAKNAQKNDNVAPVGMKGVTIDRVLRVTKPLIKGDDVTAVQNALIAQGIHCGIGGASGIYNAETAQAVRLYQSQNRLIVSGQVEKFTATKLGAAWKG